MGWACPNRGSSAHSVAGGDRDHGGGGGVAINKEGNRVDNGGYGGNRTRFVSAA